MNVNGRTSLALISGRGAGSGLTAVFLTYGTLVDNRLHCLSGSRYPEFLLLMCCLCHHVVIVNEYTELQIIRYDAIRR